MRRILLVLFLWQCMLFAYAQDKVVTGRVTDDLGNALGGVTVTEKGSSNSVTTNDAGDFSIRLGPSGRILTFSFIGRASQEVTVGDRTTINVVMQPDEKALEE
ncbi:MAG: carboxypeptidase-like regulatory domain-containing protein, partial [Chitinophagaceae bacterium]